MLKVKYGEESGYADWQNNFEVHKLAVDVEGKLRPTNRLCGKNTRRKYKIRE